VHLGLGVFGLRAGNLDVPHRLDYLGADFQGRRKLDRTGATGQQKSHDQHQCENNQFNQRSKVATIKRPPVMGTHWTTTDVEGTIERDGYLSPNGGWKMSNVLILVLTYLLLIRQEDRPPADRPRNPWPWNPPDWPPDR